MKRSYLEHIKIVSFGAFSNKAVGPFAPHLNVVYGPNEAGKTTLASFVGGVLFGWEEARGSRNTYKPANAERSGSLFFAQRDASSGVSSAPSDAPALAAPDGRGAVEADGSLAASAAPLPTPEPSRAPELELSRVRNSDGLQGDASLVADIDKETFQTMFSLTSDELRTLRNTTDVTAKLLTAG